MNSNFCRRNQITLFFSINFIIDLFNILDLILGFFRAYYTWEEQLIKKNKDIAIKYLTDWFIFDLIASVPVYTINKFYEPACIEKEISSKYYHTILHNIHYLLISNRLLKVFKVFWHNQSWKLIKNKLNDYGSIIVSLSLVFAAMNYTACIYIFIGRNSFPNWIYHSNLDTKSFMNIYICAIYILIMAITTVGYGDITCYSMNEVFFQLLILIIGIIGYSWVVSFVSNYIIKINEKSVDFNKKKEILDEIRISHANFPDDLYDRILRYLKFKNFQEKKFKNIIFDCLPVGLKNSLISEMYKPIIKNFIFFKNFQNTDFIVKVILAFKPIIAVKNDILVNEGDMVEDIMFVKKGVLSVELPINVVNPEENIDKYLKRPLLTIEKGPNMQKLGNSTIISRSSKDMKKMLHSYSEKDLSKKSSLNNISTYLNSTKSMKYSPSFNLRLTKLEQERKEREEKERERKKHLTYVKIVGIRENEHFGDVLMFLEQRSPLRVRVKSVKCELFFLKKIDAVKISTNYQNIWKRINKKSVFNFEQMKKNIKNIVELYCAVRKIKPNNKKESLSLSSSKSSEYSTNSNLSHNKDSGLKTIKEEEYLKYSHSFINPKINYIKLFQNKEMEDELILRDNNQRTFRSADKLKRRINLENSKILLNLSNSLLSSSSMPSSIKNGKNKRSNKNVKKTNSSLKLKFGQKVLDAFNRNYKFYKGNNTNIKENKNQTIISEETDQEGTIEHGFNTIIKMPNFSSIVNPFKFYSTKIININNHLNRNVNISKSALTNKEEKEKYESEFESSYNQEINQELGSSETIRVINEENLLNKKIDMDFISTKQSEINNKRMDNSMDFKNSKLQILLKCFDDEIDKTQKEKFINNNIENNIIKEKSNENNESSNDEENRYNKVVSNKNVVYNFDSSFSDESSDSKKMYSSPINNKSENIIKQNYTCKILTITNNISFQVESSYENFNLISGEILIRNKPLQNKLINYLLDEIQKLSDYGSNKNIYLKKIKKLKSLGEPLQFGDVKKKFTNISKTEKKRCTSIEFKRNKTFKKTEPIPYRNSKTIEKNTKIISQSSSIKESQAPKKFKNKFQTGIGNQLTNSLLNNKIGKKRKLTQQEVINKNTNKVNIINNNINYINNSITDFQKKYGAKRNSSVIGPFLKPRRGKDNLLSQINFNIQKTNQNLNNPEEFYSSYFNSLLEGRINSSNKKNTIFYSRHRTDTTKLSKDKEKRK